MTEFLARQERFASVGSTNDVVRDWLASGTAEVCLAIADEQTAGRGRDGRRWEAPAGAALLLSLGFRPDWLPPDRAWRLVATASLAMADAAEEAGGLADGAVRLKWPNDLVVEGLDGGGVRKLAGLLGETDGLGTDDPRVVVGLGINADWAPAAFPPALVGSMTSLREASGGRPVELGALLDAFLGRLEVRIEALRFDVADWTTRQLTTGRDIQVAGHDGSLETHRAVGVDASTGALVVADAEAPGGERQVLVGEIVRIRLADPAISTSGV
jgi:BirA family biotin operon repressor/biotin-[acetyl-CoA-carboxylase] ligase